MISGFSTEIEYDGIVYEVQTEDKGPERGLIVSSIFIDGAIVASKRTEYKDLLDEAYDEEVLSHKLQHQHKLICAAISAGRIEDLKRLK
jgi:hypothetical protein